MLDVPATVRPTKDVLAKQIIKMIRVFSAKFYRKLHFINSIQELTNCLPLESAAIPERVINYDKVKFST